jgi:hypothetical protein
MPAVEKVSYLFKSIHVYVDIPGAPRRRPEGVYLKVEGVHGHWTLNGKNRWVAAYVHLLQETADQVSWSLVNGTIGSLVTTDQHDSEEYQVVWVRDSLSIGQRPVTVVSKAETREWYLTTVRALLEEQGFDVGEKT